MEMNTLGWSSEAGNPNIQDLKENLAKAEREAPGTLRLAQRNSNETSVWENCFTTKISESAFFERKFLFSCFCQRFLPLISEQTHVVLLHSTYLTSLT